MPGPYLLVAHSYGGMIATLYARTYPESVVGMVMVDAGSEHLQEVISPEKLAYWDEGHRLSADGVSEAIEVIDAFERIRAAGPMPDLPVIVLSADKPYRVDLMPKEIADSPLRLTFDDWLAGQQRLAQALKARHVTESHSGHFLQFYSPSLVVEAIRQLVEETK